MIENKHFTPLVETKLQNGEEGGYTFSGYGAVFGNEDSHGDIIVKGAFSDFIKRVEAGEEKYPMLMFGHKHRDLPIGKITSMKEDAYGLLITAELTKGLSVAEDVRAALVHGTIDGLSIGYYTITATNDFDKGIRYLEALDLLEISVVTVPSNDETRIDLASVKHDLDNAETLKEVEKLLKQKGFTNAESKSVISNVYRLKDKEQKEVQAAEIELLKATPTDQLPQISDAQIKEALLIAFLNESQK